jgi:hypothetical protein
MSSLWIQASHCSLLTFDEMIAERENTYFV